MFVEDFLCLLLLQIQFIDKHAKTAPFSIFLYFALSIQTKFLAYKENSYMFFVKIIHVRPTVYSTTF